MGRPLLELEGITKDFPGVRANDGVTLTVGRREIHALLGENGAGKSTLVKIVYGLMRADGGAMRLDREPYAPARPSEARAHGIAMVCQHFSLFEGLTVAENIALGLGRAGAGLSRRIAAVSSNYGLKLDPGRLVGTLSAGERQRVEVVRCLLEEPKLLIMDEPTSVLTPQEIEALFATLRRLASEGCSILYISHKLEEIRTLCGRATILRAGKVVESCDPRQETARSLAEMMIGTTLAPPWRENGAGPADSKVRLRVSSLRLASDRQFGVGLDDISFEVRAGEILGIAGVAGNGQAELMRALTGERLPAAPGAIAVDGIPVGGSGPEVRRELGMCFVPEERLGQASVADMTLWENAALTGLPRMGLSRLGFLDVRKARAFAGNIVSSYGVHVRGLDGAARSLSGGNLQKFVVGREMLQAPSVLIAAQPTWGVDAGAAAAIHQALLSLAQAGAAVLVISQDLDELFAIAGRIAVISNGRLTPAKPVEVLTAHEIGLSMGGHPSADVVDAPEVAHA
ncbi:MAG: ABC transporter ATP-binding protein [Hyphomicrobiaceae bacterium]|nr:ABC transporter ATP-binding protein [Hyphomicrobiaceae bacterium]